MLAYRWANMKDDDWTKIAVQWYPSTTNNDNHAPRRKQGRPLTKWDDSLQRYCSEKFGDIHWTMTATRMTEETWKKYEDEFCEKGDLP